MGTHQLAPPLKLHPLQGNMTLPVLEDERHSPLHWRGWALHFTTLRHATPRHATPRYATLAQEKTFCTFWISTFLVFRPILSIIMRDEPDGTCAAHRTGASRASTRA
eukprot:1190196-Prorocentrum_minimum.AAC.3